MAKELTKEQGEFLTKLYSLMEAKTITYGEIYTACCAIVAEDWYEVDKTRVQALIDDFKTAFPKDKHYVHSAMAIIKSMIKVQELEHLEHLAIGVIKDLVKKSEDA